MEITSVQGFVGSVGRFSEEEVVLSILSKQELLQVVRRFPSLQTITLITKQLVLPPVPISCFITRLLNNPTPPQINKKNQVRFLNIPGPIPSTGPEPVQPKGREILSLLRLPIPPQWHVARIVQQD